ncbi:arsenical pump-driving ATPase [Ktedonobacteria bacterium brp13]|nr:arsenical pump-driving ATPase [Ktedonobacteria bacterium brp13]
MSLHYKRPLTDIPAMNWSAWPGRFLFFTGKGGVGKTTIASTIALHLAETGKRVLLVSTDPASNLNDVFTMQAGSTATPVPGIAGLSLMNLDPEAAAEAYRERVVGPYRGLLPAAAVRSMEEQLSGACTVEIAAFNEFTRLLADQSLMAQFETILFDTAPTGHTLRLLRLPSAWSGFIESSSHGANCLGPLAGLEDQQEQYRATVHALADAQQTTVVLVSRAEQSTLQEAARASEELRALGIRNQRLVLNGVFQPSTTDTIARAMAERQQEAFHLLPQTFEDIALVSVPLVASNLTGIAALRALASQSSAQPLHDQRPTLQATQPMGEALPTLDDLVQQFAHQERGVIMTMGKGGVGKTTIAAALAVALAHAGYRVHLSTTDPAAHLTQTLAGDLPAGLSVHRIDPTAEVQRYTQEVLAATGTLDADGRALLEEDLRSPCTEEIAVFRAFARTVQEAEQGFVVLDTAPTGHTLLLLDAAESYHREVARTTGQVPEEVRTLLPRLRDPQYTKVLLVTLAESTPVQEAERLQNDLRRADIQPYGWIVNASLSASGTQHALLSQRASLEHSHIAHVQHDLSQHCWLIPWSAQAPVGEAALLQLTQPQR